MLDYRIIYILLIVKWWFLTVFSGQPVCYISIGEAVTASLLKMGPIGYLRNVDRKVLGLLDP